MWCLLLIDSYDVVFVAVGASSLSVVCPGSQPTVWLFHWVRQCLLFTLVHFTESFRLFFSKFGDLEDSCIMRDRMTGLSRGFGFVTFKNAMYLVFPFSVSFL